MPNDTQITCDPERIKAFLQQQMSAAEQSDFETHLGECQKCREQLESSAASEELWEGVRESLSAEPLSADLSDPVTGDQAAFSHQTVLNWLAPTDDDRMLGRLGSYEISGVVGSGGMGVVLKAFDPALNRSVAIKVLAPHLASSGAARRRFSREAQASAAVVHENVIEIHGVADKDGLPYLVMPYVSGPSLQRRLNDEGPLETAEILRIGLQAAKGLSAAHAQGLVHRDVKPANILLEQGVERVKLTDFGLARAADDASLTKSGVIAGTPQYMSPEQARGESVDQRSDLFSLGSVLYAMCTGRSPFRAETSYGVLRRITDDEPKPIREINPEIPEWLCRIISWLISKDTDSRIQTAEELAELLEECLAHIQQPTVVALPESLVPQSKDGLFSNICRTRVLTAIALLGFGLLAFLLWQATAPPDIAGQWRGDGWGLVTLERTGQGKYSGTYTDTFGPDKGTIDLKWSKVDQRYRGTWGEDQRRTGKMSIALDGGKVRGFWTASNKSEINPGDPQVEELVWVRSDKEADEAADPSVRFGPVIERMIPHHHAIDFLSGRISEWPASWRNTMRTGEIPEERQWVIDAGIAASPKDGELIGHGTVATLARGAFDDATPEQVTAAVADLNLKEHSLKPTKTGYPVTLFFKTRENAAGILQITGGASGEDGEPIGVEIRYKLLQSDEEFSTTPQENHATSVEKYQRLIEKRRYHDAAWLARMATEGAANNDAQELWEMRAKFAMQLVEAKANSAEEQELRELLKFPLHTIVNPDKPHPVSPPSLPEVLRALEARKDLAEGSLTDVYEKYPDSIRVVIEPVYDRVDPPRFFPLIGTAILHRVQFQCTVYFTDTKKAKWVNTRDESKLTREIFKIDMDHLHIIENEDLSGSSSPGDSPTELPVAIASTTLQMLGSNGRPVADNAVIRGSEGYTGAALPSQLETLSDHGVISLSKLKPGTHWLLVNWSSILRLKLPAAKQRIVRTLPLTNTPQANLRGKNLDVQSSVETTVEGEFIVVRIHNRDEQDVQISDLDLQLMTSVRESGADARVFSPLWKSASEGKQPPLSTIEPGATATLRINWTDWVRRGFWFSRDGEVIAEPTFPDKEPGKTWVRVVPGSSRPVSVTHPDLLVAGNHGGASDPATNPSDSNPGEVDSPTSNLLEPRNASSVKVLTATQAVKQGIDYLNKRQKITVRCQVDAVKRRQFTDEYGKDHDHWELLLTETTQLSVIVTPPAERALQQRKIDDIPDYFTGKTIEIEGTLHGPGRETPIPDSGVWI